MLLYIRSLSLARAGTYCTSQNTNDKYQMLFNKKCETRCTACAMCAIISTAKYNASSTVRWRVGGSHARSILLECKSAGAHYHGGLTYYNLGVSVQILCGSSESYMCRYVRRKGFKM
jgi:hypothetical protein